MGNPLGTSGQAPRRVDHPRKIESAESCGRRQLRPASDFIAASAAKFRQAPDQSSQTDPMLGSKRHIAGRCGGKRCLWESERLRMCSHLICSIRKIRNSGDWAAAGPGVRRQDASRRAMPAGDIYPQRGDRGPAMDTMGSPSDAAREEHGRVPLYTLLGRCRRLAPCDLRGIRSLLMHPLVGGRARMCVAPGPDGRAGARAPAARLCGRAARARVGGWRLRARVREGARAGAHQDGPRGPERARLLPAYCPPPLVLAAFY